MPEKVRACEGVGQTDCGDWGVRLWLISSELQVYLNGSMDPGKCRGEKPEEQEEAKEERPFTV